MHQLEDALTDDFLAYDPGYVDVFMKMKSCLFVTRKGDFKSRLDSCPLLLQTQLSCL